jgi:two-component system, chemotaxis family, chemotaxis protein CheY
MKPVFLVDDSATMLASMAGVLKQAGVAVETAANAEQALAKLASGPPLRLIITDYHMPGMNGVELIKAVRKLAPYRFLPILVLTTVSEDSKRNDARAAGATGWLVKPVASDKLLQVIKQVAPE